MEPTLTPGALVLVWWGRRVRVDDLIVFAHPHHEGLLTIKRVTGADPHDPQRWWVERDNPAMGTDSWSFGSIPADRVLARVLLRLPTLRRARTRE